MRVWIGLLAAPLLLGLAQTAGAKEETHPGKRGGHNFWHSEQMVETLALTPEQIEQLEADSATFAARGKAIAKRTKASRQEMREALAAEEFSAEKVTQLGKDIADLAAERATLNTERKIAVRRVLSAEQWSKLESSRKQMGEKMKKKMRGGPRGEAVKQGWMGEPEATE